MKLDDLRPGARLSIKPSAERLEVISAGMVGSSAVEVVYRGEDQRLGERLLYRADESNLTQGASEAPWTFDVGGNLNRRALRWCPSVRYLLRADHPTFGAIPRVLPHA